MTDNNICVAIRRAVITLQLSKKGIIPDRVGSHSLQAGGAMALKFAGADRDNIKKMGRWSSDTFLVYIHDQIAEYSEGWTNKMSVPRSFFNPISNLIHPRKGRNASPTSLREGGNPHTFHS